VERQARKLGAEPAFLQSTRGHVQIWLWARLMVRKPHVGDSTVRLNIVVNWLEELKQKAR
jgi:hypothetical protein